VTRTKFITNLKSLTRLDYQELDQETYFNNFSIYSIVSTLDAINLTSLSEGSVKFFYLRPVYSIIRNAEFYTKGKIPKLLDLKYPESAIYFKIFYQYSHHAVAIMNVLEKIFKTKVLSELEEYKSIVVLDNLVKIPIQNNDDIIKIFQAALTEIFKHRKAQLKIENEIGYINSKIQLGMAFKYGIFINKSINGKFLLNNLSVITYSIYFQKHMPAQDYIQIVRSGFNFENENNTPILLESRQCDRWENTLNLIEIFQRKKAFYSEHYESDIFNSLFPPKIIDDNINPKYSSFSKLFPGCLSSPSSRADKSFKLFNEYTLYHQKLFFKDIEKYRSTNVISDFYNGYLIIPTDAYQQGCDSIMIDVENQSDSESGEKERVMTFFEDKSIEIRTLENINGASFSDIIDKAEKCKELFEKRGNEFRNIKHWRLVYRSLKIFNKLNIKNKLENCNLPIILISNSEYEELFGGILDLNINLFQILSEFNQKKALMKNDYQLVNDGQNVYRKLSSGRITVLKKVVANSKIGENYRDVIDVKDINNINDKCFTLRLLVSPYLQEVIDTYIEPEDEKVKKDAESNAEKKSKGEKINILKLVKEHIDNEAYVTLNSLYYLEQKNKDNIIEQLIETIDLLSVNGIDYSNLSFNSILYNMTTNQIKVVEWEDNFLFDDKSSKSNKDSLKEIDVLLQEKVTYKF
jgi:hypothetical protein